jgi:hypothetical protein
MAFASQRRGVRQTGEQADRVAAIFEPTSI